jgi:hypothetical protein
VRRRYILAPEAALDLVQIWRYIKNNASIDMADQVESAIREKIVHLAEEAIENGIDLARQAMTWNDQWQRAVEWKLGEVS